MEFENRMPNNPVATHWSQSGGYIKDSSPVCGIGEKVNSVTYVSEERYKFRVNCEHCLFWLWDREQPARKMDVDQRVVNMTFNNTDIDAKIERAIEMGIAQGLEKGLAQIKDDFFESKAVADMLRHLVKSSMRAVLIEPAVKDRDKRLVEGGVRSALQSSDVRKNIIGMVKIAVDEIEDEYESSGESEEDSARRKADMVAAVNEVLDKHGLTEAGVGTTFVQNIYSPDALDASEIYREGQKLLSIREPVLHYRKLYQTNAVCGFAAAAPSSSIFTPFVGQVTCRECRKGLGHPNP